jgi:hypothetical protein
MRSRIKAWVHAFKEERSRRRQMAVGRRFDVLGSLAGRCHGSTQEMSIEPGRSLRSVYLRAAQAYMLISMPTGTSTILGVFQVIPSSLEC